MTKSFKMNMAIFEEAVGITFYLSALLHSRKFGAELTPHISIIFFMVLSQFDISKLPEQIRVAGNPGRHYSKTIEVVAYDDGGTRH